MEVAPGVHRFGDWFVNWYVVEDEGELTVVDAGQRGHLPLLERGVREMGREMGDVKALVLTHADVDHIGFAEELRSKHGVRVHVHEDEAPYAAGKSKQREGGLWRYTRYAAGLRLMARFARPGALDSVPVSETTKFRDGERLRVPGSPRAIHTPGHSPGLCALHFEDRKVLIAGDAIVTRNPLTGRVGPQIQPSAFNTSTDEALASLTKLEHLDANRLLPGHGEPWSGSMKAAVTRALAAGPS